MRFVPTAIPEVILVEPDVHRDGRGHFIETWHAQKYKDGGIGAPFVQDNESSSVRGTLRGMHSQRTRPQGKLLRVIDGEIYDVAVDLRKASPTFLRWIGVTLTSQSAHQIWVPPGFAHGFCVMSETAVVAYKCTDLYVPSDELRVRWDDPRIGIRWPVSAPILAKKDAEAPFIDEILHLLPER